MIGALTNLYLIFWMNNYASDLYDKIVNEGSVILNNALQTQKHRNLVEVNDGKAFKRFSWLK